MSSSNRVRVTLVEESVYGVTPGAGNFSTLRYTSETLSGSPETTTSEQIRTDRYSSGQVVTGLTVGGDTNHELAKEGIIDGLIESAMYSTFAISAPVAVDLTIDTVAKTITRAAGDWNTSEKVGDILKLTAFSNTENNVEVMLTEITSATVIKYVGPKGMIDETGLGTSYEVADQISIGLAKKSYSMEKKFEDLTDKGINYRGMIASQMSLSFTYGEIATLAFTFQGNDYKAVDVATDLMTNGRIIDPPATTNSMNGSVDMPFIVDGSGATFDEADFCIQSVEMSLNNNLTPQTCIGQIAPQDYSEGTAQIEVSMSAYLADQNWTLLSRKLSQAPFAIGFLVKNVDGFYGFFMPGVQVTFDDPASPGANQEVSLSMSGTAKVGANGESPLTIYKS